MFASPTFGTLAVISCEKATESVFTAKSENKHANNKERNGSDAHDGGNAFRFISGKMAPLGVALIYVARVTP